MYILEHLCHDQLYSNITNVISNISCLLIWLYFEINKGWSLILDQTIKCTLVRGSPFTKFGCRSDWPGMTSVWPLNQAMHYIALTEPSSTHFNTEPLSMLSWNEVSLLRSSSSPLRGSWVLSVGFRGPRELGKFHALHSGQLSSNQWRSQDLPGWATRPPGWPKWGRK